MLDATNSLCFSDDFITFRYRKHGTGTTQWIMTEFPCWRVFEGAVGCRLLDFCVARVKGLAIPLFLSDQILVSCLTGVCGQQGVPCIIVVPVVLAQTCFEVASFSQSIQEPGNKELGMTQLFRFSSDSHFRKWSLWCKLAHSSVMLPLPGHDSLGRKVLFCRWGVYDPKEVSMDELIKSTSMVIDLMLEEDELSNLAGVVWVGDCTGVTIAHAVSFTPAHARKSLVMWQVCVRLASGRRGEAGNKEDVD